MERPNVSSSSSEQSPPSYFPEYSVLRAAQPRSLQTSFRVAINTRRPYTSKCPSFVSFVNFRWCCTVQRLGRISSVHSLHHTHGRTPLPNSRTRATQLSSSVCSCYLRFFSGSLLDVGVPFHLHQRFAGCVTLSRRTLPPRREWRTAASGSPDAWTRLVMRTTLCDIADVPLPRSFRSILR